MDYLQSPVKNSFFFFLTASYRELEFELSNLSTGKAAGPFSTAPLTTFTLFFPNIDCYVRNWLSTHIPLVLRSSHYLQDIWETLPFKKIKKNSKILNYIIDYDSCSNEMLFYFRITVSPLVALQCLYHQLCLVVTQWSGRGRADRWMNMKSFGRCNVLPGVCPSLDMICMFSL